MDVAMNNIHVWRRFNARIPSQRGIGIREALEQEAVSFKVSEPRVKSPGPTRKSEKISLRVVTTRPDPIGEILNLLTRPHPTRDV